VTEIESLLNKLRGLQTQVNDVMDTLTDLCEAHVDGRPDVRWKAFRSAVHHEVHRSERYNHRFSVAVLGLQPWCNPRDLGSVLRHCRLSDAVGLLNADETPEEAPELADDGLRVGLLMPQTDRAGARTVVDRLTSELGNVATGFGLAVYPDDDTNPDTLLDVAMEWGNSGSSW